MGKTSSCTGRANTVLVFGRGNSAKAVITTVVAHVRDKASGERIRFVGPGIFEGKTAKHVAESVLATADCILRGLNLSEKYFDISVVNLDASAIMDVGLQISGFSADVPILLAILSASLQMAVPEDIVSTGHVASPDGDIRMVKNIPTKLEAALQAGSINRFVHPAIPEDDPLDSFSQGETQSAADALTMAKRDIVTIGVRDIGELVRETFSDEQAVLASLNHGYYMLPAAPSAETGSGRAIQFLSQNERGVWAVLERQLIQARNNDAKDILLAFVQYHIDRRTYPKGFGRQLFRLIHSLPPRTRRHKVHFPLLATSKCIQLIQFAKEPDHEDVTFLFRSDSREKILHRLQTDDPPKPGEEAGANHEEETLEWILSEISRETLTNKFSSIDTARVVYIMDSVTVTSHEEFKEVITSFYLHLLRHVRKISEPVDLEEAQTEAFDLLEKTFSRRGGSQAAQAEAKTPVRGGIRFVLDMVTEAFKREAQEKHIRSVLKTAIDPLDRRGKARLMEALMKRLNIHLEPEINSEDYAYFAGHFELIIHAYVQSMEQMDSLLRSL